MIIFSKSTKQTKGELAKMNKTAKLTILCLVICQSISSKSANAHDGMHMDPPPAPMMMGPTSGGGSASGHDDMHMPSSDPMMMMPMHMTFFWGKNTQILFSGWPGTRSGMYAAALLLVFFMAVAVEWMSHWRLMMEPGQRNVAAGIAQTAVHGIRIGFAYLVMLALMSFNGGVFIIAVVGHLVGFMVFGSRVLKDTKSSPYDQGNAVC